MFKEKLLEDGSIVHFKNSTKEYGQAEFGVCPVIKRGKLVDIFIFPLQQKDIENYYRIPVNYKPDSWSISSWTHKGIGDVRIWLFYWCKEHKCQGFRLYVPLESNCFEVSLLTTLSITFDRK
jgi:hypothetical protein